MMKSVLLFYVILVILIFYNFSKRNIKVFVIQFNILIYVNFLVQIINNKLLVYV